MLTRTELEDVIRRTLNVEITPIISGRYDETARADFVDRTTAMLATRIIHAAEEADQRRRAVAEQQLFGNPIASRDWFAELEAERRTPVPPPVTNRAEAGAAARAAWLRDLADPRKPNECRCGDGEWCTRSDCRNNGGKVYDAILGIVKSIPVFDPEKDTAPKPNECRCDTNDPPTTCRRADCRNNHLRGSV